ncbi:hypothetical protein Asppvi_003822 [Aspergillus pseudoviridinutans]|uniref:Uncharacterized protein n=1 Tax=Aspergillus pseudoviridinutans TaxID=1517512 RepID=A0A9P3ESQ9_9EURO|nr:uncharacterized protein Asppvi_003822 [Aspergillus pseudoviridinutans]GIJ84967.1 hypothetical protein Asppvi_003822 [Aspergillus pseudoviridinutans]
MAEFQQPWDSYNDHGLEILSDGTDIESISELESVYSATESDKNFIAVDDYIAPEEPDPSYSPSDSESSSSQSSLDIAENYSSTIGEASEVNLLAERHQWIRGELKKQVLIQCWVDDTRVQSLLELLHVLHT